MANLRQRETTPIFSSVDGRNKRIITINIDASVKMSGHNHFFSERKQIELKMDGFLLHKNSFTDIKVKSSTLAIV